MINESKIKIIGLEFILIALISLISIACDCYESNKQLICSLLSVFLGMKNLEMNNDKVYDFYITNLDKSNLLQWALHRIDQFQFHKNILIVWRRNFAFKMKKRSVQTQTVSELLPSYLNTLFKLVR